MKSLFAGVIFLHTCLASAQTSNTFFSFGIDYRQYPIDIEDVQRGGYSSNAMPREGNFWNTSSICSRYGLNFKENLSISLASYIRYNHNHFLQGVNLATPQQEKIKEKKKIKFDFFLDVEKKFSLKKGKNRFLTALAGIGFTNINTGYDIFLQDTLPSGPIQGYQYTGNYLRFGPRINLGYQYERLKFSIDTYVIEGPDLTNLTSLWFGASLCYEIPIGKKNKTSIKK
jgi:hypothetical protein